MIFFSLDIWVDRQSSKDFHYDSFGSPQFIHIVSKNPSKNWQFVKNWYWNIWTHSTLLCILFLSIFSCILSSKLHFDWFFLIFFYLFLEFPTSYIPTHGFATILSKFSNLKVIGNIIYHLKCFRQEFYLKMAKLPSFFGPNWDQQFLYHIYGIGLMSMFCLLSPVTSVQSLKKIKAFKCLKLRVHIWMWAWIGCDRMDSSHK